LIVSSGCWLFCNYVRAICNIRCIQAKCLLPDRALTTGTSKSETGAIAKSKKTSKRIATRHSKSKSSLSENQSGDSSTSLPQVTKGKLSSSVYFIILCYYILYYCIGLLYIVLLYWVIIYYTIVLSYYILYYCIGLLYIIL